MFAIFLVIHQEVLDLGHHIAALNAVTGPELLHVSPLLATPDMRRTTDNLLP